MCGDVSQRAHFQKCDLSFDTGRLDVTNKRGIAHGFSAVSALYVLHAVRTVCQLEKFTVTGFLIDQYDVRSLVGYTDLWGNSASIWEFTLQSSGWTKACLARQLDTKAIETRMDDSVSAATGASLASKIINTGREGVHLDPLLKSYYFEL